MSSNLTPCQLPLELLFQICGYFETDVVTLSALSQTCHALHILISPFLNAYFRRYARIILYSACQRGLTFTVRRCLALGKRAYPESHHGRQLLISQVAVHGHADVIHALLDLKDVFCVNCSDQYNRTPLRRAVIYGRTEAVRALLERGAGVGKREIEMCIGENRNEIAQLLGAYYAPVKKEVELVKRARREGRGCVHTRRRLRGMDNVKAIPPSGNPGSSPNAVRVLLAHGLDLNKEAKDSIMSLLAFEIREGHRDITIMLLEAGADVYKDILLDGGAPIRPKVSVGN